LSFPDKLREHGHVGFSTVLIKLQTPLWSVDLIISIDFTLQS